MFCEFFHCCPLPLILDGTCGGEESVGSNVADE